jgi:hypothetical protein
MFSINTNSRWKIPHFVRNDTWFFKGGGGGSFAAAPTSLHTGELRHSERSEESPTISSNKIKNHVSIRPGGQVVV